MLPLIHTITLLQEIKKNNAVKSILDTLLLTA